LNKGGEREVPSMPGKMTVLRKQAGGKVFLAKSVRSNRMPVGERNEWIIQKGQGDQDTEQRIDPSPAEGGVDRATVGGGSSKENRKMRGLKK